MAKLKAIEVGYIVTVNDSPTGLALRRGGGDIVLEKCSSLKDTRLYFDTTATSFPSRKAAQRAIERTKLSVIKLNTVWVNATYKIVPLVRFK
jgi:hypothetical protein